MEVRCILCGQEMEIPVWDAYVERIKGDPAHRNTYLCKACQIRCEAEAKQGRDNA